MTKTRAIIKLAALRHNLQQVRKLAPTSAVLAMVKANAYGHGVCGLLPALETADALGVARLQEAQQLRDAGWRKRIVLMIGVTDNQELQQAQQLDCDLVLHDITQLSLLHQCRQALHLWLKMDSGMHRLGLSPAQFASAYHALLRLPQVRSITALQHFACADELGNPYNQQQWQVFTDVLATLPQPVSHSAANSAAILSLPHSHGDWVRPGLMLYGVAPFSQPSTDTTLYAHCQQLQTVMQLEGQVLAVKSLHKGDSCGYNQRWQAERPSTLAYVACGYADGYPVNALNQTCAAVNGVRVPVAGRVSMDTLALDCTDLTTPPAIGEFVELWGETIPVAEIARAAGLIPYQLLSGVGARVARIYHA